MVWLGAQGLVPEDAASEGARLASLAGEIIPRAEAAVSLLRDHLEQQGPPPEGDVIEGYFRIARIESSGLWLESDEDGQTYGPTAIPPRSGRASRWTGLCPERWPRPAGERGSSRSGTSIPNLRLRPDAGESSDRLGQRL